MLQPLKKSFRKYVQLGLESSGTIITDREKTALKKLGEIDDAILILDDIIDQSLLRNGLPTLYREKGLGEAVLESQMIRCNATDALHELMRLLDTESTHRVRASELFNAFQKDLYIGERMKVSTLEQYLEQVRRITGGHIAYGLAIGTCLANGELGSGLFKAAESYGNIRQIVDDVEDYYGNHHEPFGDFIHGSLRAPELFFLRNGGDKKAVMRLLDRGKYEEAKSTVLSSCVRKDLYSLCKEQEKNTKNKEVSEKLRSLLLVDYAFILSTEKEE